MFEDEIESEEILTSLTHPQAADVLRPLLPGAKLIEMRRCTVFDLEDGDKPWAMVSVFEATPTLVEIRYLAGAADPRCARLKDTLHRAFAGTTKAPEPPREPTFRERLLDSLRGQREGGIRIRRLHFGPPASPETIARIERDHLGYPMPEAMRSFFEAHDGVSLFFHRVDDPSAEITDHSVPLAIESEEPVSWSHAMWDGGPLWQQIEEADFGRNERTFFYVGLIAIPSLAEIFDTDWGSIHGWPKGTWLFDSWSYFHGTAIVRDEETQGLYIQPTTDAGADRSAAWLPIGEYLDTLAKNAGTDRVVNGRYQPVRSHG